MKIVRIEIPGGFLDAIDATEIFAELESLEIFNAYQYDRVNFFSLQHLRFKESAATLANLEAFLTEKFHAHFIQIIEKHKNEVTCLLKQNLATGFFKLLNPGPWAIIFPLVITPQLILLNILAEEDTLSGLYDLLSQFSDHFKVISTENIDNLSNQSSKMQGFPVPWPKFSTRQKEISAYAASNGYFNTPKRITGEEIAAHFGLSITTINEHLRNAQNIAMKFFFGGN